MKDSVEAKYRDIQRLSDERISELRSRPGVRVIGVHDTPPTSTKSELWDCTEVKTYFLSLLRCREEWDQRRSLYETPVPAKTRAHQISTLTGYPMKRVLEFRRIYRTLWDYALARDGTTADVVDQLCGLLAEAKSLQSQPTLQF